jgi:cell volume regulation protein A
LEAESGFNDPMAIALTIGFITWIQNPAFHYSEFILLLVQKLGIGLVAGLVFGRLAMYIFSHIPHSIGVFAPVISIAAAIISFGSTELIGGSGFLAVYMVGIAVGSTPSRYRGHLTTFHEGFAFVFQVAIFIILGLLVVPHKLLAVALPAILLTVISVVLIRPLAIWASLPFGNRVDYKEKLLLGWAGLRGAVPIVLATYVVSEGLQYDDLIFNIVFFVVLASTVLQGTRVSFQFGYESDIRRCKEIYGTEDLTQLWPLMRVINGSIFLPFSNPVIRWAGSGGYWCDADINQLA